jgi:hypothetical protein
LPLAWDSGAQIELPRGARARVAESHGGGLATPGSEFAWPSLRDGGHLIDLTSPAALGRGRAVLCYVELPRARLVVRCGRHALEVRSAPGIVTHARVWVNNGHVSEDARSRRWWRRSVVQPSFSVGPAVGAPDQLSEAVGSWGAARWIEPGETVTWDVRIRVLNAEE